jgi:16S rRNA (cytosine967-C5)-methyltransferase
VTSARFAAARVLLSVATGRDTLASALERERAPLADSRDRALCGEIATGALRWRNELDALMAAASRRAVEDIDEIPRAILRLGIYQLRHLDRVPAHAVVHESVEIARTLGAPNAAGFVNAVLRQTIRKAPGHALPARPATMRH